MLLPIQKVQYRHPITTVFPETIPIVPGMEFITPSNEEYDAKDGQLSNLLVIDYRYNRLAVDPRTGLFAMVRYLHYLLLLFFHNGITLQCRDWRDPQWTSIANVQRGVDEPTMEQRLTLFNKNEIDIEGKSTASLLVDEVGAVTLLCLSS